MGFHGIYHLVNQQFAIEHGPVGIVELPIKHGGFPSVLYVFQKVILLGGELHTNRKSITQSLQCGASHFKDVSNILTQSYWRYKPT